MDKKKLLKQITELRKELEDWLIEEVKKERFVHSTAEGINETIDKLCSLEDRLEE